MIEPSVIFQRSHAGRTEIHEKKCGLTQSERLVLIMIDGVSTYSGVRAKLPVLKDERFERAIHTLQQKELIHEVLMPVADQSPEEVDRTIVDRFLQQDPLDPVTIIMLEDDERLDFSPSPTPLSPSPQQQRIPPARPHVPQLSEELMEAQTIAVDPTPTEQREFDDQQELNSAPLELPASAYEHGHQATAEPDPIWSYLNEPDPAVKRARRAENAMLFYWGLTVVGAFVLGFAAARLSG